MKVSIKELNNVIQGENNLCYGKEYNRFDIAYIAGLMLLNHLNGCQFVVRHNIEESKIWELRQTIYSFLRIYGVNFSDIFSRFDYILPPNEQNDKRDVSRSFAPIMLIRNLDDFRLYFENDLDSKNAIYEYKQKYISTLINAKSNELEIAYFQNQDSIITALNANSPIHTFVFSILYHKINPFVSPATKDINDPKQRVHELWDFTVEYIKGLKELGKNIYEHSGSAGVITIRAYDKDSNIEDEPYYIGKDLETFVWDLGESGIMPTLRNNSEKQLQTLGKLTNIYAEDLEVLNQGFTIADFLQHNSKIPKILNQQTFREIAHYGLISFNKLILQNMGLVAISSKGLADTHDTYSTSDTKFTLPSRGTSYFFSLPFNYKLFQITDRQPVKDKPSVMGEGSIKTLSEIRKFKIINTPENANESCSILKIDLSDKKILGREDELQIFNAFDSELLNVDNISHLCIDLNGTLISPSSLLRILAYLSCNSPKDIILYNLKNQLYVEFINNNMLFLESVCKQQTGSSSTPFWYNNRAILIYTKLDNPEFYFADILYGQSKEEFNYFNKVLSHTFFNSWYIQSGPYEPTSEYVVPNCFKAFFSGNSLLPFDILLKNNGKQLFIQNLEILLDKEIINTDTPQGDKLLNYINEYLDGHKISNTHVNIGSKLHATDFYYAKRLFHDSFYSSRMAIILADKIAAEFEHRIIAENNTLTIDEREKKLAEIDITLVGYEKYSEMMLSLIRKFMSDMGFNASKINHFITIDYDGKLKQEPHNEPIHDHVVIIVPIASTGGTSVKIKNTLTRSKEKYSLHNIILAYDSGYADLLDKDGSQNYLVRLHTKWLLPDTCEYCFNDTESKSLIETDKTALTPITIFQPPKKAVETPFPNNFLSDFNKIKFKDSLLYKKVKRNSEFLLFSTNTDQLIEDNKSEINSWLETIHTELYGPQKSLNGSDRVIIISPCHYSNMRFIEMVNDIVFGSSATIIHYQTDVDYLQNFELLYKKTLSQPGAKVIFVDDSLISGKTFFKVYDLFRYTVEYKTPLYAAIFLSDKAPSDIRERVGRTVTRPIVDTKYPRKYSFLSVNIPSLPKVMGENPLEYEINRYRALSKIVLHDVLRWSFSNKADSLEKFDAIMKDDLNEKSVADKEKHLRMFKATHCSYNFFSGKYSKDIVFEDFLYECGFEPNRTEDRTSVMKVLSQYPLVLYLPIRTKAFDWHKKWLNEKIDKLTNLLKSKEVSLSYDEFSELKFLIRRSVFLGNYRILQGDFFKLMRGIMNKINQNDFIYVATRVPTILIEPFDYIEKDRRELNATEKKNLEDFHIFLLTQYVEIVHKNKWCALYIIKNTCQIENNNPADVQWGRFLRMLRNEMSVVSNYFVSDICNCYDNTDYFASEEWNERCEKPEYEITKEVLKLDSQKAQGQFQEYIKVKTFLRDDNEGKVGNKTLSQKTEMLFNGMRKIIGEQTGAFFIVKDGKDNNHLVYDCSYDNKYFINELSETKHKILFDFLSGELDSTNTSIKVIVEYAKQPEKGWKCLYEEEVGSDGRVISFMGENKSLLLIRISDENDPKKCLGLMGLYGMSPISQDILAKQLLMLLREDLSRFVKRHHKNDEFYSLREAEAIKRFAYLAGHGRHMMKELAKNNPELYRNVVGTMEKIQYFFAVKYTDSKDAGVDVRDEFKWIFTGDDFSQTSFNDIKELADDIFATDIIETNVDIIDKSETPRNSIRSEYKEEIIKFICFELFINAKKNRFVLINDFNHCDFKTNHFRLNFESTHDNLFKISIWSTGPKIDQETETRINDDLPMKPKHEISGIDLIRKVITMLNEKNSLSISSMALERDCNFHSDSACCGKDCRIYKNEVIITLFPLK